MTNKIIIITSLWYWFLCFTRIATVFLPSLYHTAPAQSLCSSRVFDTLDLIVLKRNYASPGITLRNTQPHVLSEKPVHPFRSMVSPLGPEVLQRKILKDFDLKIFWDVYINHSALIFNFYHYWINNCYLNYLKLFYVRNCELCFYNLNST